ncbi:MAG TPA: hypothetical protein VMT62_08000 [Syntrophorhabdaceae bacterium]|nr:hypothetical protein [Syntrophorhabdaceae bacterium]
MRKRTSYWLVGAITVVSLVMAGVSAAASDGMYEVVSPLGKSMVKVIAPAPRLSTLEGKKIGLIWNAFTNGDVLAEAFANLLKKRFGQIETVNLPSGKGLSWGDYPDPSIKDIVKEAKVDAVIVTVGG